MSETEFNFMEDFEAMLNASFERVNNGDVKEAVILAVNPDYLLVDIGSYMDGIVPKEELLSEGETMDAYHVGDRLTLTVLHVDTREGGSITLSRKSARKALVWQELSALKAGSDIIEVKVEKAVKGGLRVSFSGSNGFIPASQVSDSYVEDLAPYEGKTLRCLVLEINEEKHEFTASARRVLEMDKKAARDRVFADLKPGDKFTGKVVRLADFGAFVRLTEGVDGLVHVSDLSWSRVKHPSELLKVDDVVTVTVKSVDAEKGRISLLLKDLNADPWNGFSAAVDDYYGPVKVTSIIDAGCFAEIAPGIEGFIPVSQVSSRHLRNVREVLNVGDDVYVKVTRVDKDKRQVSLTMIDVPQDGSEAVDVHRYVEDEDAVTNLGGLLSGLKLQ